MDFSNRNPQRHPAATHPDTSSRPVNPVARRAVINDFAPRPHAPFTPQARPAHHAMPVASPVPHQPLAMPPHQPASTHSTQPPRPEAPLPRVDLEEPYPKHHKHEQAKLKEPKEPHETGHNVLVGFIVFFVLTALVLSPLLPGKTFQNFPGNSVATTTGEQTIGCAGTLSPLRTATSYNYQRGFPVTYGFATTTTITATCDGAAHTATGGHTSEFNPLGALLDVAAAVIVSVIVSKIWRRIFSPKRKH